MIEVFFSMEFHRLRKQTATSQTPPDNPQREDLLMMETMARADFRPRERKTASCFEAREASYNSRSRDVLLAAARY
jgi:hypothetical protein